MQCRANAMGSRMMQGLNVVWSRPDARLVNINLI